ncbi:MAG: MFS transporter [Candidatus Bathyarchaeota archaeon]|nr:MAG: MFS transporter [Candidatus Bathyarchaeota archaeon]
MHRMWFACEPKMSEGILTRVKAEFSFMRGNLLTLIVSWLFVYFTFSLVFPFESRYIEALGAPPVIIGLMGSIGAAMLGLVRIPGAYIADKFGRKQITVTMTFVIAISFLFYVFAPDWRFVLLGMVISNLSLIYQPALQAILADSVPPEKRGMGFAATNVIPNIPTIFAPAVAGFLVETQGMIPGARIVYTIVFFCMLAAAFVRLFFLKETLEEPRKIRLGEMKEAFAQSIGSIAEAWRSMSSSLKFLTLAFLISAFEDPMFRWFTALYVNDVVGVTNFDWGLVNTVSIAVTIICGFPLGKLVDRIPRKKGVLLAYVIFMPSTVLFILSRSFVQLLLVFIMFGVGGCLIGPAYSALQADMIPKEKRGRIMGTIGTLNVLATVPASALAGLLYDLGPAYPFAFSLSLGIVVSLIVLFAVKEPEKREV